MTSEQIGKLEQIVQAPKKTGIPTIIRKRIRRTVLVIMAMCFVAVITGCFDYEEEIWVNKNGSARCKFEIRMDEPFASTSELGETLSGESMKKRFQEHEHVRLLDYNKNKDEDYTTITADVEADSLQDLFDYLSKGQPKVQVQFSITEQQGTLRLQRSIKSSDASSSSNDNFGESIGRLLVQSAVSKYHWVSIIHFENGLISANSESKDASTVTWNYPISRLMSEGVTMTATYNPPPPPPIVERNIPVDNLLSGNAPIIGGILVLIAAIIFAITFRKR